MTIKQLSIFLENKSGRLTEVLEALAEVKVNIIALTVADTSEYGILRMIVSSPDKAYQLLKSKGFSVNLNEVLSIATPVGSGSFAKAMRIFSDEKISIEYVYAFSFDTRAIIVMRTENTEATLSAIKKHKMDLVRESDLYEF
jgi:hypothetical protein